ncbi:MAG: flagellar hook assembly protein FlgD [Proteobacteria bacterium]|nr:flagellar hook assembly protein FlgD [Pseudomonadota bacterium]
MVNPIQATSASAVYAALNGGASTTAATATTAANATQNQFMTLLVTQLKNQDPLNPMDNAQMTSQMAQINTVSGINQLNTTLQALSASMTPNQTVQATTMIGHGVLVAGSGVDLVSGSTGLGGFSLPTPSDSSTVSIYDSTGALVNTLSLGAQPAGITKWQWDGTNSSGAAMPTGSYTFTVNATLAGNAVAASNLQYGTVNSVTQGAKGLTLSVGSLQNIALTQVQQIL